MPGTLDVRVRGDTIFPSSILARFSILCAILRQFHLIFTIFVTGELEELNPDAYIVDQLSAGLPFLRILDPATRILFYTHFPDLLLAQGRSALWKRAYRIPFDFIEQYSMSFADAIAVNSGFTKGVVEGVWPELGRRKELQIVYPCVDTKEKKIDTDPVTVWTDRNILLSINRFERKKNIELAIKAYAGLGEHGREGVRLVLAGLCPFYPISVHHANAIAGGYDHRVSENVLYHKELDELASSLGLKTATTKTIVSALNVPDDIDVLFLLSVPNALKEMLLKSARLLIYTPANEHFGIVPLEAMLAGLPVLAANTGGPLETIVEGETGWLRSPSDPESWTEVINQVLHKTSPKELQKIKTAGVNRVKREFSDTKMAERFDEIITSMAEVERRSVTGIAAFFVAIAVVAFDVVYFYSLKHYPGGAGFRKKKLPPFALSVLTLVSSVAYVVVGYAGTRTEDDKKVEKDQKSK